MAENLRSSEHGGPLLVILDPHLLLSQELFPQAIPVEVPRALGSGRVLSLFGE